MKLTTHFSLEELVQSFVGERLGIDNTPSTIVIHNLTVLAEGLEKVRKLLPIHNTPLHINSGYRCSALNKDVKGSKTSAHMEGWAADFTCAVASPKEIVRAIAESDMEYDQVIEEGTWVHISFDPRGRRQVLTASFGPNGTTYKREY